MQRKYNASPRSFTATLPSLGSNLNFEDSRYSILDLQHVLGATCRPRYPVKISIAVTYRFGYLDHDFLGTNFEFEILTQASAVITGWQLHKVFGLASISWHRHQVVQQVASQGSRRTSEKEADPEGQLRHSFQVMAIYICQLRLTCRGPELTQRAAVQSYRALTDRNTRLTGSSNMQTYQGRLGVISTS